MNCDCQPNFALVDVCKPLDDYRSLKKDSRGMVRDFRKCPMRRDKVIEIIYKYNNAYYDHLTVISQGTTQTRRIQILKTMITKQYKLTEEDFNIILDIIKSKKSNVITTKHPAECITELCHSTAVDGLCFKCEKKRIKRFKYLNRPPRQYDNTQEETQQEETQQEETQQHWRDIEMDWDGAHIPTPTGGESHTSPPPPPSRVSFLGRVFSGMTTGGV